MWVMQSYLRPDLLADAGVADVDAWGAVFTGTTASVEMNASGSRLAPVTRVGRFGADARRNLDQIRGAARESLAELGADVSMDEVARRAGVGVGVGTV